VSPSSLSLVVDVQEDEEADESSYSTQVSNVLEDGNAAGTAYHRR
jgi:hypothetical protein